MVMSCNVRRDQGSWLGELGIYMRGLVMSTWLDQTLRSRSRVSAEFLEGRDYMIGDKRRNFV